MATIEKEQTEPALMQPAPYKSKTLKQCTCGATKFQGPFPIGEIVDGVFVPAIQVFTCRQCHKQYEGVDDKRLVDRVIDVTGS